MSDLPPRQELLKEIITDALDLPFCMHDVPYGCIHCRAAWAADAVENFLSKAELPAQTEEAVVTRSRETDYAYIQTSDAGGVRYTFLRVVRPDTVMPANTYTTTDAHVDIDANGEVIGITAFIPISPPVEAARYDV